MMLVKEDRRELSLVQVERHLPSGRHGERSRQNTIRGQDFLALSQRWMRKACSVLDTLSKRIRIRKSTRCRPIVQQVLLMEWKLGL